MKTFYFTWLNLDTALKHNVTFNGFLFQMFENENKH